MKIAVLTNAFGPPGGAGRIAEMQAGILEVAGHQVRVFRPEMTWLGWPAPIRLLRHLADLFSHREMVDKIIAWHPDILLTHNLTGCGFGTPSAVQSERTKWIHVLHDVQLFEPSGRLRVSEPITYWQKLWSGMRRPFFRSPDAVISPTRWLLDQHTRRGWFERARIEVVPNPAPPVSFALRAPSDPLKLFFLGRVPEKGTELLARLVPRLERVHLHVIEPSREMDALAERFPEKVKLSDFLPNEEVVNAMREADVMLFPSQIMENQPTVLLEAASVGLPAVASDVGGVRETLGDAGFVVPRDDEDAWIKAIDALRNPETYREQSTMMYELAKRHDPETYAARFLSLIASQD